MGIVRAEVVARMRGAAKKGLSASRFISDMKTRGLSYRRSDMLADWRTQNEIEKKGGLLRFVRRDRFPTGVTVAKSWQELSKEYMYKIKVESVLKEGDPITERFVNILSDVPMTPAMIEAEVAERWGEWEKYGGETITKIQVWSAIRKVMD